MDSPKSLHALNGQNLLGVTKVFLSWLASITIMLMIFITQTNTGTMMKCVPQEQMFDIQATLLENLFLPSSGLVMLMSVGDVLIS